MGGGEHFIPWKQKAAQVLTGQGRAERARLRVALRRQNWRGKLARMGESGVGGSIRSAGGGRFGGGAVFAPLPPKRSTRSRDKKAWRMMAAAGFCRRDLARSGKAQFWR